MIKVVKTRFLGEVYTKHMFPFPGAERMSEEERDTLEMMVDPADSVRIKIRFFLMIPIGYSKCDRHYSSFELKYPP